MHLNNHNQRADGRRMRLNDYYQSNLNDHDHKGEKGNNISQVIYSTAKDIFRDLFLKKAENIFSCRPMNGSPSGLEATPCGLTEVCEREGRSHRRSRRVRPDHPGGGGRAA